MQGLKQLFNGSSTISNLQRWGDLIKGNQYKCTLSESRMGKHQPWLIDLKIAYKQNIQIERPWAIKNRRRTVSSELLFDCQQFI